MPLTSSARAWLVVAGLALAAYPALRPYGPESGLTGAADYASPWWVVAHTCGMVGFVALALAVRQTTAWIAAALLSSYYGAETYGLHALGAYAVSAKDAGVLEAADAFRYAPLPVVVFAAGLLGLAATGVRLARSCWPRGGLVRASALLVAAMLVAYLPQFFGPAWLRVAHGAALGVGLLVLAVAGARNGREPAP